MRNRWSGPFRLTEKWGTRLRINKNWTENTWILKQTTEENKPKKLNTTNKPNKPQRHRPWQKFYTCQILPPNNISNRFHNANSYEATYQYAFHTFRQGFFLVIVKNYFWKCWNILTCNTEILRLRGEGSFPCNTIGCSSQMPFWL